jgi:hypothetical protein
VLFAGVRLNPNHVRLPMERFFSHQSIELYRKLLDISADESQRRLILKFLAAQAHTMQMGGNPELRVRTERRGDKYTWALHRDGRLQSVKFSGPVYSSEEAARASGNGMRSRYLARLAAKRPRVKQCASAIGVSS